MNVDFEVYKAEEFNVDEMCEFAVEDINETVKREKGYDCVIFEAAGNVLGDLCNSVETLNET